MYSIHLHQLRFFGFHGLYPEEATLGNEFEVNVTIRVGEEHPTIDAHTPPVDYSKAFQIIDARMKIATPLLETLATEIANDLLQSFPPAVHISISICKLHPPIPGFTGKVGVEFDIARN
ncbi:MAG: dihydroneopterin aldolase [Sediminibacterium sp.]|nr:dihydroneopterin aldolase [Sediminibacterium sp.]